MPDVPNVPGVPRLSSFSSGTIPLLIADAAAVLSIVAPSQWGIYRNGILVIGGATPVTQSLVGTLAPLQRLASLLGAPNILPVLASTIEFEFAQEWPISNYPQEQGAFQSYNKVTLPFDVKVKVASGGAPSTRQIFLRTCLGVANSLDLFDIVTPEITFTNCSTTHIDFRRTARRGVSLIEVDLWFQKIEETAIATFTNTQQPGEAGQQGVGVVQPQAPTLAIESGIQAVINRGGGGF